MYVEIYTKPNCNYCRMAKEILNHYNVPFVEKRLDVNFTREQLLEQFPSAKTYPVVTIDGFNIGGYNELSEQLRAEFDSSRQVLLENN